MKSAKDDSTPSLKTLSERVNDALADGYSENFKVVGRGLVSGDEKKSYQPEKITISNFYRFEGYSDPEDNAILYLIRTDDGTKGTLVDAYGAYADAKISSFIKDVEEINKEVPGVKSHG